jgi:hypothetical protein
VCAPPLLLVFIAGTVGAEGEASAPDPVVAELPVEVVAELAVEVALTAAEGAASADGPAELPAVDPAVEEPSSADAIATPWPVATAAPTPSATASAPTRPTCLAWPGRVGCADTGASRRKASADG